MSIQNSEEDETLERLLENLKSPVWRERSRAATNLAAYPQKCSLLVGPLLDLLGEETQPQVKKSIIKTLGEIGASEAKVTLKKIKRDVKNEEAFVRQAAFISLRKLSQCDASTQEESQSEQESQQEMVLQKQSTPSKQLIQSTQPSQSTKPPQLIQKIQQSQPAQLSQLSLSTPSNQLAQKTQQTQPTQPSQQEQPSQPSQQTQPSQPSQQVQPPKPSQQVQSSQPSQQAQPPKPSQQAQPPKPSQQAQPSQPSQQAQPSQPSQQAQPSPPSQQAQLSQPSQQAQPSPPSQQAQPSQPSQPSQQAQPSKSSQLLQLSKSTQPTKPTKGTPLTQRPLLHTPQKRRNYDFGESDSSPGYISPLKRFKKAPPILPEQQTSAKKQKSTKLTSFFKKLPKQEGDPVNTVSIIPTPTKFKNTPLNKAICSCVGDFPGCEAFVVIGTLLGSTEALYGKVQGFSRYKLYKWWGCFRSTKEAEVKEAIGRLINQQVIRIEKKSLYLAHQDNIIPVDTLTNTHVDELPFSETPLTPEDDLNKQTGTTITMKVLSVDLESEEKEDLSIEPGDNSEFESLNDSVHSPASEQSMSDSLQEAIVNKDTNQTNGPSNDNPVANLGFVTASSLLKSQSVYSQPQQSPKKPEYLKSQQKPQLQQPNQSKQSQHLQIKTQSQSQSTTESQLQSKPTKTLAQFKLLKSQAKPSQLQSKIITTTQNELCNATQTQLQSSEETKTQSKAKLQIKSQKKASTTENLDEDMECYFQTETSSEANSHTQKMLQTHSKKEHSQYKNGEEEEGESEDRLENDADTQKYLQSQSDSQMLTQKYPQIQKELPLSTEETPQAQTGPARKQLTLSHFNLMSQQPKSALPSSYQSRKLTTTNLGSLPSGSGSSKGLFSQPLPNTGNILQTRTSSSMSLFSQPQNSNSKGDHNIIGKLGNVVGNLPPSVIVPIEKSEEELLSPEQRKVLEIALSGTSFFFTGAAGTGKSFLLKVIVKALRNKFGSSKVFVCASTGVAACNIGGCTLHSFAGVGLGEDPQEKLAIRVIKSANSRRRWATAKALIIDEVSMLDPNFFDKLEYIAREVRKKKKDRRLAELPFGGIQVILCGDFFQLPPVKQNRFLFQAKCWNKVIRGCYELLTVFRQRDKEFVTILNEIRRGQLSPQNLKKLQDRQGVSLFSDDGIEPTILYPNKHNVDKENTQRLNILDEDLMIFKCTDNTGPYQSNYLDQLKKSCPAKEELSLKVGAQVILLKNIDLDKELSNGARGTVIKFVEDTKSAIVCPLVKFIHCTYLVRPEKWVINIGDKEVASREQIPLDLAWAMSIHKSQGMTIDRLKVHVGGAFASGQVYVALSRATSLEGLSIADEINPKNIFVDKTVLQFYEKVEKL